AGPDRQKGGFAGISAPSDLPPIMKDGGPTVTMRDEAAAAVPPSSNKDGASASSAAEQPAPHGSHSGLRTHMSFWLAMLSGVIASGGLVVICVYAAATPGPHLRFAGVGLLTALAALSVGCLFGFLFGIPRVVSSGAFRLASSPTLTPGGSGQGAPDSAAPSPNPTAIGS